MRRSPRSLEISVRIYRMFAKAYPASFRREYGPEMTQLFRDLAGEALRQRGAIGLIGVWVRMVPDLVFSAIAQHFHEMRRRMLMLQELLGPSHFIFALAVALLIAGLVTPADPLSQVLVGLPLYGVYLCVLLSRPLPRPARLLLILVSLLNPASVPGLALILSRIEPAGVGQPVRLATFVLLFVPLLTTALTVGLTVFAVRVWAKRNASRRPGDAANVD